MKRARLNKAQAKLHRIPLGLRSIDDAYSTFLAHGTLPTDRTLAGEVLHRALHARKPLPPSAEQLDQAAAGTLWQPYGTTREMLFREAVCDLKEVRDFARSVIEVVVKAGHDPTDPELFGPEVEPMDFVPVCMRLMHWPEEYVRPEYQGQLARVLRQLNEVRAHRPLGNEQWDRGAGAALSAFLKHGQIPTDTRFFLYVLSIGELFAVAGHYYGRCGEELLAAYESVATSTGEQRLEALRHLGELQARRLETCS